MNGIVQTLLIIAAVYFLGLPLVIYFTQRMKAHPRLQLIDPMSFPDQVRDYLARVSNELVAQGFTVAAYIMMPDPAPNIQNYLVMFINRETGDKAMATAIFANANGITQLGTRYVEFNTRYEDGRCFDTMNSSTLGAFQKRPQDAKTQLPNVQDAVILYRIHQFILRKAPGGQKMGYEPAETLDYLQRILVESYDEQVKFGRLFFDRNADTYRPTFKGAYLMTWGLLWPMTAFRKARMHREARRVLSEFEAATDAAPAFATGVNPF